MPELIAIGDMHGCRASLETLLARLPREGQLVFLGDYLDRGPDARGVIARLLALAEERPCIFLRGNHEAMALEALDGRAGAREHWLRNGGLATVESYGGPITAEHEAFLRATRPYYCTDASIFVHAGVPPGRQPEETDPDILWWIREPFLSSRYDWGRLVIHGHTPVRHPDIRPQRINIDTGAVYGGALTALLLPERACLSVPGR